MSSLPGVKKDANGMPVMVGVQERSITQLQADYSDVKKALELATGLDGYNARKAFAQNPGTSPGIITSVLQNGATADNGVVKILAQIDAQTKAKRAEDARVESARISTEKFQNTKVGQAWTGLKGAARVATLIGSTTVEAFNAAFRQTVQGVTVGLQGMIEGAEGFGYWNNLQNQIPNNASPELKAAMAALPEDSVQSIIDQTTLGQVIKGLQKDGKVDLGSGFFPSEETGAGFAARQEQLKYLKQSYVVNGQTYYRPYSFMDPASYVLTLGHPESASARIFNALGEIGFSIYTDPALGAARIATALREAKLVAETASGIKAAKAAEQVSILSAQLEEANRSIQASFEAMGITKVAAVKADAKIAKKVFGAKTTKATTAISEYENSIIAYRDAYSKFARLTDEFDNININYDDLARFISGPQGSHIIDAIANTDDFIKVQKLAKGRLTVDEAVALAGAQTREEVLAVLAPFIANGTLTARTLETGTRTSRALRTATESVPTGQVGQAISDAFGTVITKGNVIAATGAVRGATARALTRLPFSEKVVQIGDKFDNFTRKYGAYLPDRGGTIIHASNKDKLVEAVNNVGRYVNLDKDVLNGLIRSVAYAETTSETGFQATAKLFDAIFTQYASKFTGEQLDEFRKVTRVFESNRKEMSKYWAQQHATGTEINFGMVNGEKITLHSAHLDSELLNSFVYIPDAKEIMDFLKRAQRLGDARLGAAEIASDLNNLWKKSVLVRPAYIARNIIEEQIRVYGVGHISFLNRPLAAAAMWLGRDGGPKWREILNRFDDTKNNVYNDSFKMSSSAEEFAAEELAGELIDPYISFMSNSGIGAADDMAINKVTRSLGFTSETFGHPLWWQGYASQMRILHNSEFVRKVISTKPGSEIDTVNYFLKGDGRKTFDSFVRSKDDEFKDFINTESGLMQYLFTGTNTQGQAVSVLARIEEMTGRGSMAPLIKTLLLKGNIKVGDTTVMIPNAKTIAEHAMKVSSGVTKGSKIKSDLNREFSKVLEDTFKNGGDWSGVQMTLPTRLSEVGKSERGIKAAIDKGSKWFFEKAIEFEKTTTMGPEWRQAYWDKISDISHALDSDAIERLLASAPSTLTPLRNAVTNKLIGTNHKAWKNLDNATGDGPLTLDDAHKFAASAATKKVETLFYNAQKRNLLFHQLRLIFPFAQAWEDTLKAWSKIALNNPEKVYKVAKIGDWSTKSSSSALYELTDARSYYDPNQGIFYSDPTTGERKFFVPFASSGINMLQGIIPGASDMRVTGPFQFSASPQSFNFALGGGSFFPGMGAGVTWGVGMLSAINKNPLKILPAQWEEEIYKVAFPYGTPDVKNAGWLEGPLFTSNWVRVLGGIAGVEKTYASAFAPSMGYLASSGEYDLNNPDDQVRLARDGDNLARYFTMWRGISGALIPIPFAMRPEALARNKDGYTVLATSVFTDFKNLEVAAGGDKNQAYADFLDLYGPEQIFAITRTTTGYEPTNLPTYAMIKENPEVLTKYKDVYGYFYPNGELSKVLYEFQQQRGKFGKLTAQQIMDKATNIRYAAAKDRLQTRAVAQGWSSQQQTDAIKSLTDAYNVRGRVVPLMDTQWKDRAIAQLRKAVDDPMLAESDALSGVKAYLVQRDKALAAAGTKTLKAAAASAQREWLAGEALNLITKYPDFQKVYYGIFKRELEGK
jgi:hypothetical protein